MKTYEIVKKGKNNKVLVKWYRCYGCEYSVHTLTDDDELIWGHYYKELKDAKDYFEKAQNR